MSTRLDRLFSRTPGQRRGALVTGLAALIVVPLAVAGLFAGALNTADERVETLPALVVNDDEFVTTTLPDGTEQMVLAGRQLVTELTKPATAGSTTGFAWEISNAEDAGQALADGSAYAVLTIPADFSSSVTSLSGATPTQADLAIRTDDAHSFLAGSVAQSVGTALTGAFGLAGERLGIEADGPDRLAERRHLQFGQVIDPHAPGGEVHARAEHAGRAPHRAFEPGDAGGAVEAGHVELRGGTGLAGQRGKRSGHAFSSSSNSATWPAWRTVMRSSQRPSGSGRVAM